MINDFVANKILIICIVAWAIAQILKVLVILVQEKRIAWNYFITSGGMPSSHAATVCALATAIAMIQGIKSVSFSIAVVLAIIVIYDAAGVRQTVGLQSVVINRIIEELRTRQPITEQDLKEFIGHTTVQVAAGAILGIVIAWVWVIISGV